MESFRSVGTGGEGDTGERSERGGGERRADSSDNNGGWDEEAKEEAEASILVVVGGGLRVAASSVGVVSSEGEMGVPALSLMFVVDCNDARVGCGGSRLTNKVEGAVGGGHEVPCGPGGCESAGEETEEKEAEREGMVVAVVVVVRRESDVVRVGCGGERSGGTG